MARHVNPRAAAAAVYSARYLKGVRVVDLEREGELAVVALMLALTSPVGAPLIVGGEEWNLTPLRPALPPYLLLPSHAQVQWRCIRG